jgi:S-adenosylmethionine synthetase
MIAGEITTKTKRDYEMVVRSVVAQIGFDSYVGALPSADSKGLSDITCEVLVRINKQSPGIDGGVHVGKGEREVGTGDLGIMFRHASDKLRLYAIHLFGLTEVRKSGEFWWLRLDGRPRFAIEYRQKADGSVSHKRSTQLSSPLSMQNF